jgi:hypothetical protein
MARAQGPTRYVRGHYYVSAMRARHSGLPNHELHDVEGIGHEGEKMFTSLEGLRSLFGLTP